MVKLATLFLRDAPLQLQQLVDGIRIHDYESSHLAAHSLLGTSVNFYTTQLEFTCEHLLQLLKQQQWQQAEQCLKQLKAEYVELAKALAIFIERN